MFCFLEARTFIKEWCVGWKEKTPCYCSRCVLRQENAIHNLGIPVLRGYPVILRVRVFCAILNCVICVRASPWFHPGQQDDSTMPKVQSYLNSANE